ncbi:MAG: hypothetical protein NVS4B8_29420 [Herpetosiphon sp.]
MSTLTSTQRRQLATLLSTIVHCARQLAAWRDPDPRNLRLWRQLLLALVVQRSTRLLTLAHALHLPFPTTTIKSLAQRLAYLLTQAACPLATLSPLVLTAALAQLDPQRFVRFRDHLLLVIDGTDYPKRSRGTDRTNRHMQYIGRVRASTAKNSGTTTGYQDVWAGVVLRGKQFVPLQRQLFSQQHPNVCSQNQVEQAVLDAALAQLGEVGERAVVVADRGFGRKALLIHLANKQQPFVIRVDADITVRHLVTKYAGLLADLLAQREWLGEVVWKRGERGRLRCRARRVRVEISYSPGGKANRVQASMTFLEVVPLDGQTEPLVLATPFGVHDRLTAQAIVDVYSHRWAIETAFETMKGWGLDRFMVRQWQAIDRLLWSVGVAYALLQVALSHTLTQGLRAAATRLLRWWGVLGRRLTVGKLAEAIALDVHHHPRAWRACWRS